MAETMRQFYQRLYPAIPEECWLGPRFDRAVIGMAERAGELVPVYQFSSMLNLIVGGSTEGKWTTVMSELMQAPRVAVLHRPARDAFWERVKRRQLLVWELLTPAILGVMSYGASRPHAVVYHRGRVIQRLMSNVLDSDVNADAFAQAVRDYETKLLACHAGQITPYYFYEDDPS